MIKSEEGLRDYLVNYAHVTSKLRIPLAENAVRQLKRAYELENEDDRPNSFHDICRVLFFSFVCVELDDDLMEEAVEKYMYENIDPDALSEFVDFEDEFYDDEDDEDDEEEEEEEED